MNIEKILRGVVITGVFALPFIVFIVANSLFFPYIVGKNIALRAIVEIIFVAWVALAFLNEEYRPRKSLVLAALAVFVTIVTLADIFGENPIKSIWSNFERMEGLVSLLHFFAYTIVAASIFTTEYIGLWFWRVSLGVASLVSFNTFIQFLGGDKERLDSTLGNPIYLAVYALFHIFIALILFARNDARRGERIVYAVLLPLQVWVLFMTATRGATLGVIGGLFLAALGILFTLRHERKVQLAAGGLLAVLILIIGGFWMTRDSTFVQESPVLKRFSNISLTEGTVFARTVVWSMAWEGVKEKPLLGWGQENFSIVFNKYYDPRMYAQEPWFDRTHNVVFDWLIASGVLGLLAYISIFLALLWVIYQTHRFNVVQKWFLVGLLAAYSFHNLTVFDQVISYLLFFSLVAWIVGESEYSKKALWFSQKTFRSHWAWGAGVALVSVALVFSVNSKPLEANQLLLSGLRDVMQAKAFAEQEKTQEAQALIDSSLAQLQKAQSLDTYGLQEIHEQIAQTANSLVGASWMTNEQKQLWYDMAVRGLEFEEARARGNARASVFVANVHETFGNLLSAQDALLRAQAMSPRKQTILIELAANAQKLGEEEKVLPYLREAYELEPQYPTAGVFYAIRLIVDGQIDAFDAEFSDNTYLGDDSRILSVLVDHGYHERAASVWENALTHSQKSSTTFLLAAVYDQRGDRERLITSIQRAMELDPRSREEGETILRSLGQ